MMNETCFPAFALFEPFVVAWPRKSQVTSMTRAEQFEVFMKNYQNMVFSTAMRLVANTAEAEDISQEVFLKAFQRFDDLCESATAGGWLKTVTTNLSLNHLTRYKSRWSFFSDLFGDQDEHGEREAEFPSSQDIHEELEQADQHQLLEKALQELPPAQRVPLVLYHLEGFQYDEIADRLKISLGKVKTDIFRGREALRKKLRISLADETETSSLSTE
jgi:RNA polymerase sigma-70 factor (ECF subfamily)